MGDMGHEAQLTDQERLFLGLTEQLTRPFVQISQLAELARTDDLATAALRWKTVETLSTASLRLAESYALNLRVQGKVTPLELEPVTISSLLYDTASALQPLAAQYGVTIELDSGPKAQPIITDRTVLQSAMTSLGQVFISAQAESETASVVRLAAHRSRYGVVAGMYGNMPQLGAESLRRAHALQGKARQPLQKLVSGPAAGVFVADSLLHTLAAHLHVARYQNLTGLAATLQPSQQLHLI